MGIRDDIIVAAREYLGVPYKGIYQGTGPEDGGFTCSGFTWRVYNDVGLDIPIAQGINSYYTGSYNGWDTQCGWTINNGHWTSDEDNLLPGDLVFYSPVGDRERTGHVAIYYGDGMVIHANGAPVSINAIESGGWFVGGGWPLDDVPESKPFTGEVFYVKRRVMFPYGINVRANPSTSSEIVYTYPPGATEDIDGMLIANGYCWGTYIGRQSGLRRYVALGTSELAREA